LYALEELYDSLLDIEQTRREMPPPTAVEAVQEWNMRCQAKSDDIWRRLMVMEPLEVRYVITCSGFPSEHQSQS
jgi:DNA topoisomerase 2-associated protein PAT1